MKIKKILYLITEDWFFCSHFFERALAAKEKGFKIIICSKENKHKEFIENKGFDFYSIPFDRKSVNPFYELIILLRIIYLYKKISPDIVHQIAFKPIIYGSIAAKILKIKSVINAPVGMGYVFTSDSQKAFLLKPILKFLILNFLNSNRGNNRKNKVIFENKDDLNYFISIGATNKYDSCLIRGAGVQLNKKVIFKRNNKIPVIAIVSRMLKDKGVYEFVEAAKIIKNKNIVSKFILVGGIDKFNPSSIKREILQNWHDKGLVDWLGNIDNVDKVLEKIDILCLPSYREGLPKALLEGAANGLPLITTDTVGCRDVVVNEINGYLVPVKDGKRLASAMEKLIRNKKLREKMGQESYRIVSTTFSSSIIIPQTLKIYDELCF